MRDRTLKFVKYYLPALIWAGGIFYLSGIPSLRYTQNVAEEVILRKGAHFLEYAVLAFLLFRIFRNAHQKSFGASFFWSLILASVWSASDEMHQFFVVGRTGKFIDAFFDMLSSLFALECLALLKTTRKSFGMKMAAVALTGMALLLLETYMILQGGGKASVENTIEELRYFPETVKNNVQTTVQSEVEDLVSGREKPDDTSETALPSKISLEVPFTPQAPFANWDAYHEEACEEASLIMLKYFLDGKKLTPDKAEQEIQNMIAYEIKNYGDYEDTSAQQNADLFYAFYGKLSDGKNLKVIYDFSKEDLKKYLSEGNPIIVPAAGRELGNPYFTQPGPVYHNLLLTGYDGNMIITNDPGTKRGKNYRYNINTLYSAIHDFPGNLDDIDQGRKAMIVVSPDGG